MNREPPEEQLFAFYDRQLPPEDFAPMQTHVRGCARCRKLLQRWEETSRILLRPLRAQDSERFVQKVMNAIPRLDPRGDWPRLARWAFPALAVSITGFAVALLLTLQPLPASNDPLLSSGSDPSVSADELWRASEEDPILNWGVVNR